MHNTYQDRGIIKWAPFDALVGYHGLLNDLKEKMGRKERPVLSDDDYESLNRNLNLALEAHKITSIYYFKKGYIHQLYGYITKADFIKRRIIIDHQYIILADDLISIECI